MRPYDHAEVRATEGARGRYPRPEDDLSRFDRWDRDRASAPRPIRRPAVTAYWVRVGLLVAAAAVVGVLVGVFGVPTVPR